MIEQGLEIGRDGRVLVEVNGNTVRISGTAVYTAEFEVEYNPKYLRQNHLASEYHAPNVQ